MAGQIIREIFISDLMSSVVMATKSYKDFRGSAGDPLDGDETVWLSRLFLAAADVHQRACRSLFRFAKKLPLTGE